MEDERRLIERLQQRDEAAFSELVERHHSSLLLLANFFVSSQAVAEEVVQETWLAVLRGIDRFEQRSSFKTWISRIVMNLARTRGVRESRMVPFSQFADSEAGHPEEAVDPTRFRRANDDYPDHWSSAPRAWNIDAERLLLNEETLAVLNRAIDSLPQAQRLVLTMRDINDCSPEEICNILAISETNRRVLLHRARSKVRSILESHFSTSQPVCRDNVQLQGENREGRGTHLQGIDRVGNGLPRRTVVAS